jgi:hypothetical protein
MSLPASRWARAHFRNSSGDRVSFVARSTMPTPCAVLEILGAEGQREDKGEHRRGF